jgi:hypothetical protein
LFEHFPSSPTLSSFIETTHGREFEHNLTNCLNLHLTRSQSFSSLSFESNAVLKRIEPFAFSNSSLPSIMIPQCVELLCLSYFSSWRSFSSNLGLKQIEARALNGTSVRSVVIPSTVYFITLIAFYPECQISLLDVSSCPEFEDGPQSAHGIQQLISDEFRDSVRVCVVF